MDITIPIDGDDVITVKEITLPSITFININSVSTSSRILRVCTYKNMIAIQHRSTDHEIRIIIIDREKIINIIHLKYYCMLDAFIDEKIIVNMIFSPRSEFKVYNIAGDILYTFDENLSQIGVLDNQTYCVRNNKIVQWNFTEEGIPIFTDCKYSPFSIMRMRKEIIDFNPENKLQKYDEIIVNVCDAYYIFGKNIIVNHTILISDIICIEDRYIYGKSRKNDSYYFVLFDAETIDGVIKPSEFDDYEYYKNIEYLCEISIFSHILIDNYTHLNLRFAD